MFKNPGPILLIFAGPSYTSTHLLLMLLKIMELLYFCYLVGNTTHELQPLDKAVFQSYEAFWDQ